MKRGVRSESKAPFAIVKSISALPNKRRKSGASRTYAQRRNQTNPPYQVTSPPDQLELLRAPAAVLIDVDAALRVDGEAVGLVEFAGVGSGATEIAEDFAAATHGRPLSAEELEMIRQQIEEGFDNITEVDAEIRAIVARNWPHLLFKLPPEEE
jgi:hypothetical protein